MSEPILHHFDASPFAEKARLAFGIKDLAWRSVEIPMIMPKPDLMPLTGGYRKTPTLQVGAEVYCDTALILSEIDRRWPEPPLFAGTGALAAAMSTWSDRSFFEPGAGLSMGLNEGLPDALLSDRKAFFKFMDFDRLGEDIPHLYGQFLAQVALLEGMLDDGRDYLGGDRPNAADILGWFPLWMARGNFPQVGEWLDDHDRLTGWEMRIRDIGYGQRSEMTAADALAEARDTEPEPGGGVDRNPEGLWAGDQVTVTPTDYGAVPVEGTLIGMDFRQITVRRSSELTGGVNTHFPRAGYRVEGVIS